MNEKPFAQHIYIAEHCQLDQLKFQNTFLIHADLELLHDDVFQL